MLSANLRQAYQFEIVDFSTALDLKLMRNRYKAMVEYLATKITILEAKSTLIESNYAQITKAMCGDLDTGSSGGLVTVYDEKYTIFTTKTKVVMDGFTSTMATVRQKQTAAAQKLAEYEELVRQEEARQAELMKPQIQAPIAPAKAIASASKKRR